MGYAANAGCVTPNVVTGSCSCPAGYAARLSSMGCWYNVTPCDGLLMGTSCEVSP